MKANTEEHFSRKASLGYNPTRTYAFTMPDSGNFRIIITFLILGTPALFLFIYDYGSNLNLLHYVWIGLGSLILSILFNRLGTNHVVVDIQELIIRKDNNEFIINLFDIEDCYSVDRRELLDSIQLPDKHFPMEFESSDKDVIVLILRDGTYSRSSKTVQDSILTKFVSFNVKKPAEFLTIMQMRAGISIH